MNELTELKNIVHGHSVVQLFTIKDGITPALLSQFVQPGLPGYAWTNDAATAGYLVFPCNYEIAHDADFYTKHINDYKPADKEIILQHEAAIISLSKQFNKKIIIIYYSDNAAEIKIDNAIIFRTSIIKSAGRKHEISMPVLKNDLSLAQNIFDAYIQWRPNPSIGFRGITAPQKFNKLTRTLRNQVNLFANRLDMDDIFNLNKNFGYLERRNAAKILQRNKNIITDFTITGDKDADDPASAKLFIDTVFRHPYTLCVAGFGNYSYRFFETLSAGRIPVFIDTDCKLPFEEFINWKEHVVWIDKKDIYKVDKILLAFHQQHADDFIAIQRSNKALWKELLSPQKFFINIQAYL